MSSETKSQKTGRSLIERETLGTLLEFRTVLEAMLAADDRTILDAIRVVRKNPKDQAALKKSEMRIREVLKEYFGIVYVDKVNGNRLLITERYKKVASGLKSALSLIDASINAITVLSTAGLSRGNIAIGSIVSVINYIGPALLSHARQAMDEKSKTPHFDLFPGELDLHLQMLQTREIDFAIGRDAKINLAANVEKFPLPMEADETGLTFRLQNPLNKGAKLFPELFSAVASCNSKKLERALCATPLLLLNPLTTNSPDPLLNAASQSLSQIVQKNSTASITTLPSARTVRQFVQLGLGVGIGHRPRGVRTSKVRIGANATKRGVAIASDVDSPGNDIVFVPFSMLSNWESLPKATRFALYFRRGAQTELRGSTQNAEMSPAALWGLNCVHAIVSNQLGNFGYLRFRGNELVHDYHFTETPRIIMKTDAVVPEVFTSIVSET